MKAKNHDVRIPAWVLRNYKRVPFECDTYGAMLAAGLIEMYDDVYEGQDDYLIYGTYVRKVTRETVEAALRFESEYDEEDDAEDDEYIIITPVAVYDPDYELRDRYSFEEIADMVKKTHPSYDLNFVPRDIREGLNKIGAMVMLNTGKPIMYSVGDKTVTFILSGTVKAPSVYYTYDFAKFREIISKASGLRAIARRLAGIF